MEQSLKKKNQGRKSKEKKSLCGIFWKKIQGIGQHFQAAGFSAVPDRL